ncbi:MAG TPA: rhomboid family intramembrane serine protease [Deltaproteobacteria bacterium]|nr:rhomboid family intramembrane serine protease [Deltaproteobacteria bacterium]
MNRQSILCPKCRKLISMDEPRCPFCGTPRPGVWWKNKFNIRREDFPIRVVISACMGLYIISLLFSPWKPNLSLNPFTLLSPDNRSLLLLGATGTIPIVRFDRWWTLITANYLHGNLLHIFFNMVAFRQLAYFVLREYGTHRFVALYTLSGVAGFVVSYLAGVRFTLGASAAVCGLIGASLYYGKSRGGSYGQAIYRQIGGWAIGIFAFGFLVPGINNWAHGGGIAAGVILGYLFGYRERQQEMLWHRYLAFGCVIVTVAALGWAVASSLYYRLLG